MVPGDRKVWLKSYMGFMNKMERKFSKYAIPNLSLYLILCYAAGYLVQIINSDFIHYLSLNPFAIMQGQVWRIFTWILIPPSSSNIFFVLLMLYFYYSIGTSLERTWGAFYYNVYIFGGILFTILASFGLAGYLYFADVKQVPEFVLNMYMESAGTTNLLDFMAKYYEANNVFLALFTTYYINMSIFLAYAATYPDMMVLLMFMIPVKVKYLGIIYAVMIVLEMVQGGVLLAFTIGASLLNFVIFFLVTRKNKPRRTVKQVKRQMEYRQAAKKPAGITRHKCAICGRTEQDDPTLEFRFCSKCEGNYEYCQYHLFTHEHVKRS